MRQHRQEVCSVNKNPKKDKGAVATVPDVKVAETPVVPAQDEGVERSTQLQHWADMEALGKI